MFGWCGRPASYARQLRGRPPLQSLFPGRNHSRSNVLPLAGKDLGGGRLLPLSSGTASQCQPSVRRSQQQHIITCGAKAWRAGRAGLSPLYFA